MADLMQELCDCLPDEDEQMIDRLEATIAERDETIRSLREPWVKSTVRWPDPGRSYLVRTIAAGPVYDVAFYNGILPGGQRSWVMTDCELNSERITHWAELPADPEQDVEGER